LVIAEGKIKAVKLESLNATATICAAEEFNYSKIKCSVTFKDMKNWGLDSALCIEETCMQSGVKV